MARYVGFEEKEYEIPLLMELTRGRPGRLWTPGQVLEAQLGFDAALIASEQYWRHVKRQPTKGMDILMALGPVLRFGGFAKQPKSPTFGANLFLQVKRPAILRRRPEGIPPHWGSDKFPWFRIRVPDRQKRLLELLHSRAFGIGGAHPAAEVALIAPTLETRKELWRASALGLLLHYSNSPSFSIMKGHSAWVYQKSGGKGFALSKPKFRDIGHISARLQDVVRAAKRRQLVDFRQNINQIYSLLASPTVDNRSARQLDLFPDADAEIARRVGEIALLLRSHGFCWLVAG